MEFKITPSDDINSIVEKLNIALEQYNLEITKTKNLLPYDLNSIFSIGRRNDKNNIKGLNKIKEKDVIKIVRMLDLPYVSYLTNDNRIWDIFNMQVQICIKSSINGDINTFLRIYGDGKLSLIEAHNKKDGGDKELFISNEIREAVYNFLIERGYKIDNV